LDVDNNKHKTMKPAVLHKTQIMNTNIFHWPYFDGIYSKKKDNKVRAPIGWLKHLRRSS
jgi:hypothetical protein